ncbi:MAG: c-type cytochrome [Actinobacteria bacterium]|nr:c-type cytochrome [Actinomycetota bacterium]
MRVASLVAIATLAAVTIPTTAVSQESGDPANGREVFSANCAMCHGSDAAGMMGMHPSLRGAIERLSREGVEVAIRQGRRTQPPMPAWEGRLSNDEIDNVIAYIATLPDGPRNFGADGRSGMMMGGDGDGMRMPVIALVVVLAAAAAGLVAWTATRRDLSPLRVLDRRYAAGELSREEYLQRRADLRRDGPG